MSTFGLRIACVLLALGLAAPSLAQVLRAGQPVVKVGDSTVYRDLTVRTGEKRDTTFVLTAIDADRIVSETSGSTSGTLTFTRDFNPIETKTGEVVTMTVKPFWPYLQFPLEVGRTWSIPFEVDVKSRGTNRHASWQWNARVAAVESVTVQAGTFQTFRIEYKGSFATSAGNQSWTGTQTETAWYAPELNRIVKRDYEQSAPSRNLLEHHVIEALSFKSAP